MRWKNYVGCWEMQDEEICLIKFTRIDNAEGIFFLIHQHEYKCQMLNEKVFRLDVSWVN